MCAAPQLARACDCQDPTLAIPKDNGFATNEAHFFGLRRRPAGPLTPSVEALHGFVFNRKLATAMRAFALGGRGSNLFLIGPPGCGKTLTIKWFAHEWGVPFYLVAHDAQLQVDDILGKFVQGGDGMWHYVDGALVHAYEQGGVYCADELPSLKSAVAQVYHPFMNRDPVIARTDAGTRTVHPHSDFRFAATGNHWNYFAGNYEAGEALCDRSVFVLFDYLDPDAELELLAGDGPDVPRGAIEDLLRFANQIRKAQAASPDANHYVVTTRKLRNLVAYMQDAGAELDEAVETFILNDLKIRYPDEYQTVEQVLRAHVALARWNGEEGP